MRRSRAGDVDPRDARILWRAGVQGRWDHFSQGWLDFTGRSLRQELEDGWLEGMHPEDIVAFLPAYLDAFRRRVPFEVGARLLDRDGAWRRVRLHGSPTFDAAGIFEGFAGYCSVNDGRCLSGPSSPGEGE